jgi:hypothetical protein
VAVTYQRALLVKVGHFSIVHRAIWEFDALEVALVKGFNIENIAVF